VARNHLITEATPLLLKFMSTNSQIPSTAAAAVLKQSEPLPADTKTVVGPDFENPPDLHALLASYERIGFQATAFGRAVDVINKMVRTQQLI
jgi:deoxyhypusine synthase